MTLPIEDFVVIGKDEVDDYNEANILPEPADSQAEIVEWLQPTAYAADNGEYRKHRSSHLASTGEWVWADARFRAWLDSGEHGMLWLKGIPGSGKSVLAASLVDRLSHGDAPVLYFFFRQIIDANHMPDALLRDWLSQVLRYSPLLQAELKARMKKCQPVSNVPMQELWQYLRMALGSLPKVYCIVDALDEMDVSGESEEFLRELAGLGHWRPSRVKVAVTSRPIDTIKRPFRNMPMLHITFEHGMVDQDIKAYVDSRLLDSSISETHQGIIRRAVPGNASGLFLYARLAMDALLKQGANVEQVLANLPVDLCIMYEHLLREHAQRSGTSQEFQVLILSWATHASRPLRLLEIAEMIHVTQPCFSAPTLKATKELVRTVCGPLLEILADETICVIHHSLTEFLNGSNRGSSQGFQDGNCTFPTLDKETTHARLATACISYMLRSKSLAKVKIEARDISSDVSDEDMFTEGDSSPEHPAPAREICLDHHFLAYSLQYFHVHLRKAEACRPMPDDLIEVLNNLLSAQNFPAFASLWWPRRWPTTKLHVAAELGLAEFATHLIQEEQLDLNALDAKRETPLLLAAARGHADVVRPLLASGARADQASGYDGTKPLHRAVLAGSADVVELLLSSGVDPLTKKTRDDPVHDDRFRTTRGYTPLMLATRGGTKFGATAFLPYLYSTKTVSRALIWAAEGGSVEVIEAILKHPLANVNVIFRGVTALSAAARYHHVKSMNVLLEVGACPTTLCDLPDDEFIRDGPLHPCAAELSNDEDNDEVEEWDRYDNALHVLCGAWDHYYDGDPVTDKHLDSDEVERCLYLMVQGGLDINARGNSCRKTALMFAAENSLVLVRALLRAGADARLQSSKGQTALHNCSHNDIQRALIDESGMAIDEAPSADGKTLFLTAMNEEPSLSNLSFYQELGADLNAVDNSGRGALHFALAPERKSWNYVALPVVKALLAAGVRPGAVDEKGRTVLHSLSSLDMDVIKALVAVGADLQAPDLEGRTPLFYFFKSMNPSQFSGFLDILLVPNNGKPLEARDRKGRTVLFPFLMMNTYYSSVDYSGNILIGYLADKLEILKERGVVTQTRDNKGNNFWHHYFIHVPQSVNHFERFLSIVEANLDAKNEDGHFPLHYYCDTDFSTPSQGPLQENFRGPVLPRLKHLHRFKVVDCKDGDGIRPLHLLARKSPEAVSELLAAGASPTEPTFEGITPLHVAARFRQPNIIGILLDAITKKLGQTGLVEHLNTSFGENVPSVLEIACRSGMPESFDLLFRSGANTNPQQREISPALLACLEFAPEQLLWADHRETERAKYEAKKKDKNLCFLGIKVSDTARDHSPHEPVCPRLEEILFTLYEEDQRKFPVVGGQLVRNVEYALGLDVEDDYTVECLLKLHHRLSMDSDTGLPLRGRFIASQDVEKYAQQMLSKESNTFKLSDAVLGSISRTSSAVRTLIEARPWKTLKLRAVWPSPTVSGFQGQMLMQRQWDVVEAMFKDKPDALSKGSDLHSILSDLVEYGLDDLLSRILEPKLMDQLDQAYRLALTSADETRERYMKPLVIAACKRPYGNLPVLRLLVDRIGVNVNHHELRLSRSHDKGEVTVEDGTALHELAPVGPWWREAEGLPFLIERGAELEARTYSVKCTPLLEALRNPDKEFKAAKRLVSNGADTNAADRNGYTCLSLVIHDLPMATFLINHGAKFSSVELFEAIEKGSVGMLDLYCTKELANSRRRGMKRATDTSSYCVEDDDIYPIHYAAVLPNSNNIIINTLLSHQADLFASFTSWDKERQHSTPAVIIHHLLQHGGNLKPFLALPNLDLERRDLQGRTLLLAACCNIKGADCGVDAMRATLAKAVVRKKEPSLVKVLLDMGACVKAQDHNDMNGLHHVLCNKPENGHDSLRLLVERGGREIVTQVDTAGNSPLNYAMKQLGRGVDSQFIMLLLRHGADPCQLDHGGNNVLHYVGPWVARGGRSQSEVNEPRSLFKHFVSLGVPINGRNNRGETPLCSYIRSWVANKLAPEGDARSLLLDAGADITTLDDGGNSLLHVVAAADVKYYWWEKHMTMLQEQFKWLVDQGLDPTAENKKQQTCLDIAMAYGVEAILDLFKDEA